MIDIKDTESIVSGIDKIKANIMEFPHPENFVTLFKIIKKNVPWYRRKDFYSYVTYMLLSGEGLQFSSKENKDISKNKAIKSNFKNKNQPAAKKDRPEGQDDNVLWINFSPRNSEMTSAFKSFIAVSSAISEDDILSVAAKRYCSFVSFANADSMNKALKSLNGKTFEGRTIKANFKNKAQ